MKNLLFFLLLSILCSPAFSAVYYVNTNSTAGGNGTTNATEGANRAFASGNEAAGLNLTLTEPCTIYFSGTVADGAANFNTASGWSTSAANRLFLEGNNTSGKWDDTKYHIEVINGPALDINVFYCTVRNIQAAINNSAEASCIRHQQINTTAGDIEITGCIIKNNNASPSTPCRGIYVLGNTADRTIKLSNNIVYGMNYNSIYAGGILFWGPTTLYIYNNTVYGNSYGIRKEDGAPTFSLKNNLCNGNSQADYANLGTVTSASNISEDTSSPDGATYQSIAAAFTDETNKDFLPTQAYNGTDLRSDAYPITIDAKGVTRAATPTVGALEYVAATPPAAAPTGYVPQVIIFE